MTTPQLDATTEATANASPDFATALRYWLKLGLISFGGPAGQIAIMQQDLVERLKWVRHAEFQHALNFCMMLPGPEAQQLATYLGWRLHGLTGALAAGTLFVLPGAIILLALSWLVAAHGDIAWVAGIFAGLKPVVVAIVFAALWRLASKGLKSMAAIALAIMAFAAVAVFDLPFPLVVLIAAGLGIAAGRNGRGRWFTTGESHGGPVEQIEGVGRKGDWSRAGRIAFTYAALITIPTGLLSWLFGSGFFAPLVWLFTKAAFVTFGGAYAVLPYVADAAVNELSWLSADQMMNGLALAETTPGPLILVLQYVGFFAGWNDVAAHAATGLSPPALAVLGALTATYATFLPSTCLILAGAPLVGGLGKIPAIASALGAISAAVVGVIANLGLFFANGVVMDGGSVDPWAAGLAIGTFVITVRFKPPIHWLVAGGAVLGLLGVA